MAEKPYLGYNNSGVLNLSNEVGTSMLDKFSRIRDDRRLQPLDQILDNVCYPHRSLCTEYNLAIGDTFFIIPPEFIMVTSESQSQSITTLRQENSQKEKTGYHKKVILIDLIFNGMEQLNGFPVEGPEGTYYVDGLRQLLAQFKCVPILPITNELVNNVYGIFSVALQSITMSTVEGYPNTIKCQITLQEIELFPYINMPNIQYKYIIDWDLFRFYYQRFLTEKHEYRKLQSFGPGRMHNAFKLSILDESVFSSKISTKYNLLDIITDTNIVKTKEDGTLDNSNYITWVSSETGNVHIVQFDCGYSNLLTNIQLSDSSAPTVQFLGGMDTIFNIVFETDDYTIVQSLEQCQMQNDILTRNNVKYHSVGFVKLESEFVAFAGSLFVMIESVSTNTVPGFPGLYNVQMQCVSYDISKNNREDLVGFKPFKCDKPGRCGEWGYIDKRNGYGYVSDHTHDDQTINQTWDGLETKIKQDNYAEWKLRSEVEVYPDLRLPKYSEVNEFITKCNKFRKEHNLPELPYKEYPKAPTYFLNGLNPENKVTYELEDDKYIIPNSINLSQNDYDVFVDPDFYVFYPTSYLSFLEEDPDFYGEEPKKRDSKSVKIKNTIEPEYINESGNVINSEDKINQFISLAKGFIGHTYKFGAAGDVVDSNGKCFDCSGLVTYLLREMGVIPSNTRYTVQDILQDDEVFETVPWSERRKGDLLCRFSNGNNHVVISEGDGRIIHASNSKPYPKGGVKEDNEYFIGTVRRIKAFYKTNSNSGNSNNFDVDNSNIRKIWDLLKQYGCSDVAAAGILGNIGRETGSTFDPTIKQGMTHSDAIPVSGGYGLVQFTYIGYKKGLKDYCDKNNVGVNTIEGQIGYLMTVIKGTDYFEKMQQSNDVEESTILFQDGFEKPGVPATEERVGYAKSIYNKYAGTDSSSRSPEYVLTQAEFDSICKIVDKETQGEPPETQSAIAQVIYDRLTDPQKTFGGLSNILNNPGSGFKGSTENKEPDEDLKERVKKVFCDNEKVWPDSQALYFLSIKDNKVNHDQRDKKNSRLSPHVIGSHSFWGKKEKGSSIKYVISDETTIGKASDNTKIETEDKLYPAYEEDISKFGIPVFVKTKSIRYTSGLGNKAKDLNSIDKVVNTAFCDEVQYAGKGRLLRAFPTYLFCILDEDSKWFDGRKLWTNYYIHKAVIDIAVHAANDMPTSTATITVSNSYHNLDRTQGGLASYSLKEDMRWDSDSYNNFQKIWYRLTNNVIGFGPKLTNRLIELQQVICDHIKLKEGARVHLRMGYGSDPISLAPVINGHISDISLGDQIEIVVTSDGHELVQDVVSSKKKDTNNGWLGFFGLGESQESSNIIAGIMCKRQSWFTTIAKKWFEASKHSIEHFGLFINKKEHLGDIITDIWDGYQEQYDILKNLYKANYKGRHYIYSDSFLGFDGEENIVFNKFNMTPWDMFQVCTQQVPEYIIKTEMHQFDSRLYFGLPSWLEKYRYDYINKEIFEECKTAAQVHFLDSMDTIIDNQIKVTSKFSNTNVKVMYTRGSSAVSTNVIHSDSTIDPSKQKTVIIDSPVCQDSFGPDALYEIFYKVGRDSARRIGISNLLYGWQQQYQGSLVCFGAPGVKPHDYIMINDTFSNLFGVAIVREVVHSFSTNSGYTTSVIPGMIGYSSERRSGSIETVNNYLLLLSCFSKYTMTRKGIRNNYEKNLEAVCDVEMARSKAISLYNQHMTKNGFYVGTRLTSDAIGTIITIYHGKQVVEFIKDFKNFRKFRRMVGAFINGFSQAKNAKGIINTIQAIKAGSVAAGTASGGIPGIIIAAVWIAIDTLLDAFFEWLENRNVCVLLPLWWEGDVFVCGVKDGTKILLMDSKSTATSDESSSRKSSDNYDDALDE